MSHSISRIAHITLLIATVTASGVALAGENARDGKKKGRRGPPPQAFEACEGLEVGTACEIQTRRGTQLPGECIVPRRKLRERLAEAETDSDADARPTITEDTLVCRPDRFKRRRQSELL